MQGKEPRLREQVHAVIRVNHYSIRTEKTYWYWVRYFIRFHQMKHPRDMGPREVNEFLTWLAVHRNVAAATQSQALNALVFLYGKVLDKPLGEIGEVIRSKKPRKLPVVLTHEEAMRICVHPGLALTHPGLKEMLLLSHGKLAHRATRNFSARLCSNRRRALH